MLSQIVDAPGPVRIPYREPSNVAGFLMVEMDHFQLAGNSLQYKPNKNID